MVILKMEDVRKQIDELRAKSMVWVDKVKEQHRKYQAENQRNFDEIPPAQNSPKHILNVLTDECIQKIFCFLRSHLEYFNAAETCTRFQKNAQICFPSRLSHLPLAVEDNEDKRLVPIQSLPKYLSIFGHLTRMILWSNRLEAKVRALDDTHLEIFTNSCEKPLTFEIFGENDLQFETPFHVLDKLSIRSSSFLKFSLAPFTTLKKLYVANVKIQHFDEPIEEIPTLEYVAFHWVEGLTDDLLIRFQKCVPQLKTLYLHGCKNISPSIFENVDQRIPNLENLAFKWMCSVESSKKHEEDILDLSKLKKLKDILSDLSGMSSVPLIDLFAEREVPIEVLEIPIFEISESIYKLKQLKLFTYSASKATAIQLIDKIPTLQTLYIDLKADSSPSDIIEILEYAQNHNLKLINFRTNKISIDTESYCTILALAKERVRIRLKTGENLGDLDDAVVEENREWFRIVDNKKESDPDYIWRTEVKEHKVRQQKIKDTFGTYDIPDFI